MFWLYSACRYLLLSTSHGCRPENLVWVVDLQETAIKDIKDSWVRVIDTWVGSFDYVANDGEDFVFTTTHSASLTPCGPAPCRSCVAPRTKNALDPHAVPRRRSAPALVGNTAARGTASVATGPNQRCSDRRAPVCSMQAPRKRVIRIKGFPQSGAGDAAGWVDLLPQRPAVLEFARAVAGDLLMTEYMVDVKSELTVWYVRNVPGCETRVPPHIAGAHALRISGAAEPLCGPQ